MSPISKMGLTDHMIAPVHRSEAEMYEGRQVWSTLSLQAARSLASETGARTHFSARLPSLQDDSDMSSDNRTACFCVFVLARRWTKGFPCKKGFL